jgi:hypothetical protein
MHGGIGWIKAPGWLLTCSTMSLVVSESVWMVEVRMSLVQVKNRCCRPGTAAWVVGNEPVVVIDISGMVDYAKPT